MVDTMKELQSMAVRLKTPIAIIPKLPNANHTVRIAEQRTGVWCRRHRSRPEGCRLCAISQLPEDFYKA
jgi:hypothetical protein